MSIKINGVEIGIPGPAGKSAYQAAKDAGFTGSETEFNQSMASVKDKQNKLSGTKGQIVGFNENGDAVAQSKPTYTASEVGALPSSTPIPSKTSQLTNDSGFITGYAETDPTVPSWAKASSKPTYTASEVGAAPASHTSDNNIHITSDERTAWNAKAPGTHVGDSTHITAAERAAWNAKAAKPTVRTLTLSTAGWDSTAKTQTVTCSGVLSDEAAQLITVTPALASQSAYLEAGVRCTAQAADALTFTAGTVPTAELTVYAAIQSL